jgi:hypothetical protein
MLVSAGFSTLLPPIRLWYCTTEQYSIDHRGIWQVSMPVTCNLHVLRSLDSALHFRHNMVTSGSPQRSLYPMYLLCYQSTGLRPHRGVELTSSRLGVRRSDKMACFSRMLLICVSCLSTVQPSCCLCSMELSALSHYCMIMKALRIKIRLEKNHLCRLCSLYPYTF